MTSHGRMKSPSPSNLHGLHSPRSRRSDSPLRNRRTSPGPMISSSGLNKSPERRDRRSPLRRSSPASYRNSSPSYRGGSPTARRSPLRRTSPLRRNSPAARRTSPHRTPPRHSPTTTTTNRNTSLSPRRQPAGSRRSPSPQRGLNNNKRRREERSDNRRDNDKKHIRDDRRSIYVGNLPYDIRKEELRALCSHYGDVFDVTLGARGFGFVYMDAKGARRALTALDKRTFGGRILHVNEAFKEDR